MRCLVVDKVPRHTFDSHITSHATGGVSLRGLSDTVSRTDLRMSPKQLHSAKTVHMNKWSAASHTIRGLAHRSVVQNRAMAWILVNFIVCSPVSLLSCAL